MCDPATGVMLFTAAMGAYEGQQQAKAADAESKQVEAEAKSNEDQAKEDAKAEKESAVIRAEQIRKAAKEQKAKTRAASAASGMTVDMGTALDLTTSVTEESEKDANMSIFGGLDAFKRGNRDAEAIGIRGSNESNALKNQGRAAKTKGYISAGTTGFSAYQDYQDKQKKV